MGRASANPPSTVDVSILVLPETGPMAPYGLFEVLHAAGGAGAASDVPARFRPQLVANGTEPLTSSIGIPLTPHRSIEADGDAGLIVVCDAELAPGQVPTGRWPAETAWLHRRLAAGAMVCSICSGALVLAEAGLLEGREATSHWATAALFRDFYPAVRFRPERILCDSGDGGRLVTSGGASSWQDLALYLIGAFCGPVEAARIARLFVIGDRSEGQLAFASMAPPRNHQDAVIAEVQLWIADNYAGPNPVAAMAGRSGLHERTFKRRFRQATGYGPIDYVHALRVEEAKQLLETSRLSVEDVAAAVGYAEPAHFSRLFRKRSGLSLAQWRRRYNGAGLASPELASRFA
jgi:transcriptional regulator GlxA family with amidase domain